MEAGWRSMCGAEAHRGIKRSWDNPYGSFEKPGKRFRNVQDVRRDDTASQYYPLWGENSKCPGNHPLGGQRLFAVGSAQAETGSLTVTALCISA